MNNVKQYWVIGLIGIVAIGAILWIKPGVERDVRGYEVERTSCVDWSSISNPKRAYNLTDDGRPNQYNLPQMTADFELIECERKFIKYPTAGKYGGEVEVHQAWNVTTNGESASLVIDSQSAMMSQTITLVFDATSGENTALRDEMQQQLCDFFAQREETQAICNEETPPAFISVESRFGPGAPGSTITYH